MKLLTSFALAAGTCVCHGAPTTLDITSFNSFNQYDWADPTIWDAGIPNSASDVDMPTQTNALGNPVEVRIVEVVPATVANLAVDDFVTLDVFGTDLTVTGGTENTGFLSVTSGTLSLGNFTSYNPVTKTLAGSGSGLLVSDGPGDMPATLEFLGADIEVNRAGFNLFGVGVRVTDLLGQDAFRHLRENGGFLTLDDGFILATPGDFANTAAGSITLALTASDRTPQLQIAGNFQNDGELELLGNSVVTVAGVLSGNGAIHSEGTGNSINVIGPLGRTGGVISLGGGLAIAAASQNYSGGAEIVGNGTLTGNVMISSGTLSPGNSAGQIGVLGNLSLGSGSLLALEIGATAAAGSDLVTQSGGATGTTLGGNLRLSILGGSGDGLLPGDRITLLQSDFPIGGAFANVAPGSRLATADGAGSFIVEYGPTALQPSRIVVTGFQSLIVPETFAQWAARFALGAGQNQPGDDPNADGISNLEAYFRGIAPIGPAEIGGQSVTAGQAGIVATLAASRTAVGVGLATEISADLTNWSAGPAPSVISTTASQRIYQATAPAGPGGSVFLRFKIETLP